MSTTSERYVRCPRCNFPNLSGCGVCSECGTVVDEEFSTELRRVASGVWYEVSRIGAAVGVGLVCGGLVVLIGALASRGLWLSSLCVMLTPPVRPGLVYYGPFLLAATPIAWMILGRLEVDRLGGRIELFDAEEVQAGSWASVILTIILACVSLCLFPGRSEAAAGLRPAWLWQALPLLCQVGAIAGAAATWRWLLFREGEPVEELSDPLD